MNGGISSSSSRRAHSTPMPVGPEHLVAGEARRSRRPGSVDVDRHLRHRLGAVDQHQRAGVVRALGDLRDRVDRPEDVRDVRDRDQLHAAGARAARRACRGRAGRRSSSSTYSSIAPCSSHSSCQGTMFEWCSIRVTSTTSPAAHVCAAPREADEVDRLGRVADEHGLRRPRADQPRELARARPRTAPSPRRRAGGSRGGCWRSSAGSRSPSPRSRVAGFCEVAALSR